VASIYDQIGGGVGVTDSAFDRVVEHLVATLKELAVPSNLIAQIPATVAPLRSEIVAAGAQTARP
jgi:hemoglobin